MHRTTAEVIAAAITVAAVLLLVVGDHRRTGRWSVPVIWTGLLALLTAAAFLATGLTWLAAAPGAAIGCAALATGGRPGVLVDPPPSTAERAERRHQRLRRRYGAVLAVVVVVAVALAVAASSGHLPW